MMRTSLMPRGAGVHFGDVMELGMGSLSREVDRLFGDFFGPMMRPRLFRFPDEGGGAIFSPLCDVQEDETAFVVTAEVPGFTRDELHVDVSGDKLTLKGEREEERQSVEVRYVCRESSRSSFQRTFRLPGEIDVEHVEAKLKVGILKLTLPKLPTEQERRIEVSEE